MPLTPPKIVYKFPNIVPPNAQTLFESLPGYEWANRLQTYLQQALPTSASTGGGPSTPFPQANYALVTSLNASLTNARLLTAGTNITIVDGGPNGPVTINATGTGGGGFLRGQEFTAVGSFTFNVPTNVTSVWISMVAGGGAGGGANATAPSGGGGGSGEIVFMQPQIAVSGGTITGSIGAGGTGVSAGTGNNGGNTTCGLFTALGGLGGQGGGGIGNGGQGGGPNGGAGGPRANPGGSGLIGLAETITYFGGGGGGGAGNLTTNAGGLGAPSGGQAGGPFGTSSGGQAGGGGGGSNVYGVGASGGNGGSNGSNATILGTGGGGAGGISGSTTGGNGGNGYVLIQWIS